MATAWQAPGGQPAFVPRPNLGTSLDLLQHHGMTDATSSLLLLYTVGNYIAFLFFSAPNSFSESFGKDLRKKRPAHNI